MDEIKKEIQKMEILKTAFQFFRDNQTTNDHIDEIVKYCKISKATFYSLFTTKENFLFELIDYAQEIMMNEVAAITAIQELAKDEKFSKKMIAMMNGWILLARFRSFLLGKLRYEEQELVLQQLQRSLERSYDQYQIMIVERFGPDVNDYIWDMVFQLSAYISICIQLKSARNGSFDDASMVGQTLLTLEALNERLSKIGGNLDRSMLYLLDNDQSLMDHTGQFTFEEAIASTRHAITFKDMKTDKEKLIKALKALEDEVKGGRSDSFVTDAMLALLEKEPGLAEKIPGLKKYLTRRIPEVQTADNGLLTSET